MRYTIFDVPVLRNVLQALSIIILRIFGWRREGRLPDIPKFVMIAAPHTSNWDFPIALAVMFAYKMNLNWLGIRRFLQMAWRRTNQPFKAGRCGGAIDQGIQGQG
jgi:1-acyl-sn-glycerol-3-phosphate acyltransferase